MEETLEEQIVRTEKKLEKLKLEKERKDRVRSFSQYENKYYKQLSYTNTIDYIHINKIIDTFEETNSFMAYVLEVSYSLHLNNRIAQTYEGSIILSLDNLEEISKEEFIKQLKEFNNDIIKYIKDEENN